jgi:phosphatidylserine/phosphatidylglycerophosphate/cardiolipin synthase-like enzyme
LSMHVQFGGPDKPIAALARLLHASIDNVPPGGEIHWITYYFGNRELAQALLAAHRRGVTVAVSIDARPRRPEVNRAVMDLLRDLGGTPSAGLRSVYHFLPCHVHEKLYYFSHPQPVVYAGSYNPSRDKTDRQELIEDIGDQDRGHNFLVEITDQAAVTFLRSHMQAMHRLSHDPLERFRMPLNAEYHSPELWIWFFPRRRSDPHMVALKDRSLKRVRIAASHFRDSTIARLLVKLAGRGTEVEVLCHDSLRRVPSKVERLLTGAGVRFARSRHEDGLPMHNKFMLLENENEASVLFGSLNLTRTSRWLNHEVLMKSSNRELFAAFSMRWQQMHEELHIRGNTA